MESIEQMAEELRPLVVTPEPETDVRVKVFKDSEGIIRIECSRPVPQLKQVAAHMSATQQRGLKSHIDYGRDVLGVITRTSFPLQSWADAIGAAILQADADERGGNFEVNALRESAYLALGDTLFRLSPVELIKTNKALTAVKKRASEKADASVKRKLAEGQLAADTLIETAAQLKRQAEETLRRANRVQPVPQWALDNRFPCRRTGGMWAVEAVINFRIEFFDVGFFNAASIHKNYRWDAIPQPSKPIRLWVPIAGDGSYAISSIFVDQHSSEIPHISHSAACMSLGDAPRKIRNANDLYDLQCSIERCMAGVQLDSLRTHLSEWLPNFKDSVPPELYKVLKGVDWKKAAVLARELDAATPVPVEAEATWNVDDSPF